LGIIPCGRGEDFSRNLRLPGCLHDVCAGYAEPVIREIDIPTVNGVPFHSIAGVGFDGLVSRLTRDGSCRLQGTICYILYLIKALFIFKPVDLRIELNGRVIEDRFMMAAAANAPCYGGGMRMAPDARLDDGLLDVVLIRKMAIPRLLMQFPKVYSGKHVSHKDVRVERTTCVTISSDQELEMFADGEFMGKLPVKVEVGSRKIRVLLPGGAM
jgi:YegS/Rv2252/BmrU family lipid kinase